MPVNAEHLLDPAAELVVVGYYDQPAGYTVRRARGASSWLFAWTVAGAGRVRQGGVEVEAGPADLVVLRPGVPHAYGVAPGREHWAFWWAHCPARAAWGPWLRPHHLGDGLHRLTAAPQVRDRVGEVFARLHADSRWSGHGRPPAPAVEPRTAEPRAAEPRTAEPRTAETRTAELRTAEPRTAVAGGAVARELACSGVEQVLLLCAATAATTAGVDGRVRQVEALIAADPAEPHTVASLAAEVALSPSRLAHLFAEHTGRTPMQALRAARLAHAARLLEITDLPVDRVASASGFASAFHFSRVFRARFGVPPGAYRRPYR